MTDFLVSLALEDFEYMLQYLPAESKRRELRKRVARHNPAYRKLLDGQRAERLEREKDARQKAKEVLTKHRGSQVWLEFRDGIQKAELVRRKGDRVLARLVSPLQDKQGFPMKSFIGERKVGTETLVYPGQVHPIEWCSFHTKALPATPVVYQPGKGLGRRGGSL